MNATESTLIDLGYCVAKLRMDRLTIMSPDDSGEYYIPAQSISIYGDKNLIALRDALNKAYPIVSPF